MTRSFKSENAMKRAAARQIALGRPLTMPHQSTAYNMGHMLQLVDITVLGGVWALFG